MAFTYEEHREQVGNQMTARTTGLVYRIYLLTVWQTQPQTQTDEAIWRFHLTDPRTGKRYGFTNAAALLAILQQLANDQQSADSVS